MEEADTLRILSRVLREQGQYQHAYDAATRAVRLLEETGNRLSLAFARGEMGLAQRELGEHAAALVSLTRAEEGFTEVGFRPGTTLTWTFIGTVHRALGQYDTAARFLTDAVAEQRELGVRDDELDTLIELGALALDHPAAGSPESYYGHALVLARDLRLRVREARALAGLGRCRHSAGDPEAVRYLRQALDIYDRIGLPEALPVAELVHEHERLA
jgi:tetratricopeptide (TPR) repeat protein